MRTYSTDSPHAAARIVALTLLADGHLCQTELDALERLDAHGQLGLAPSELHGVIHALCEDLLATAACGWERACRVEPETLSAMIAETGNPELRLKVLQLCSALADADGYLADGERIVLKALAERCRDDLLAQSGLRAQPEVAHG